MLPGVVTDKSAELFCGEDTVDEVLLLSAVVGAGVTGGVFTAPDTELALSVGLLLLELSGVTVLTDPFVSPATVVPPAVSEVPVFCDVADDAVSGRLLSDDELLLILSEEDDAVIVDPDTADGISGITFCSSPLTDTNVIMTRTRNIGISPSTYLYL